MAGGGWREWVAGEQLTAANMQDYLQDQSVMRFADASTRTTALSGTLTEGMISYLDDTNSVEVYDGSSWVSLVTPAIFTQGTAGDYLISQGTAGVAWSAAPTFTSSTATTYTLASTDANSYLEFTAASMTLTVGTATDFQVGQQVTVLNDGTALAIVPEGTAVELYGRGTAAGTAGFLASNQYDAFTIVCVDTDAYRIIGNVDAV